MPTRVHLVKAIVFPVVMYGCEIWTVKKAECQRIDVFELWCWRRLLRVPWTARRSNQPILKDINPEYSLEVLMLKLNVQYLGHLMWRADSLKKTLMLEKVEVRRRRGWQSEMVGWHHWLKRHELEQTPEVGDGQEAWCDVIHGFAKSQSWLSEWTDWILILGWWKRSLLLYFLFCEIKMLLALLSNMTVKWNILCSST